MGSSRDSAGTVYSDKETTEEDWLASRCTELQDSVELALDLLESDEIYSPITNQVIDLLKSVL